MPKTVEAKDKDKDKVTKIPNRHVNTSLHVRGGKKTKFFGELVAEYFRPVV